MPEPKSMLAATSEANNLASLSEAKDYYIAMMEGVCGGDKAFVNEHILEIEHLRIRDAALDVFSSRRKMGGEEFSAKYREQVWTNTGNFPWIFKKILWFFLDSLWNYSELSH